MEMTFPVMDSGEFLQNWDTVSIWILFAKYKNPDRLRAMVAIYKRKIDTCVVIPGVRSSEVRYLESSAFFDREMKLLRNINNCRISRVRTQ